MKPHLFPNLPKEEITDDTQIYTQRKSDDVPPVDQKFTVGDLKWILLSKKSEGPLSGFSGLTFEMGTIEQDNITLHRDGVRLIQVDDVSEINHPLHFHKESLNYTFHRPAFESTLFEIEQK